MHYKTNRQNHDFQIAYFLAGSCHTPDAAYALLTDLREDRLTALTVAEASNMRLEAKRLKIQKRLKTLDPCLLLEARADLIELESDIRVLAKNIAGAETELHTIDKCIAAVQPFRKYGHLTDAESHQAAQAEEWRLELISRAENFLISAGSIPYEHMTTMRMHPAFATSILPAIDELRYRLSTVDGAHQLLAATTRLKLLPPLENLA